MSPPIEYLSRLPDLAAEDFQTVLGQGAERADEADFWSLVRYVETVAEGYGWDALVALREEPAFRDAVIRLRRWLLKFETEASNELSESVEPPDLSAEDVRALSIAERLYGASWLRRGGVGAYMVTIRKYDRIEQQAQGGSILDALRIQDFDPTGVLDDLRDLRRYLYLWEAAAIEQGLIPEEVEDVDWEEMTGR